MPSSKSSMTSRNERRMITMANRGLQYQPYCYGPCGMPLIRGR
ncbi:MAG: hypothetical protein WAV32_04930 [Halobacteriota archaeon]